MSRYLGDHGAVISRSGTSQRVLAESSLPLRAEATGPLALGLQRVAGGWRPRRPLVPLTIVPPLADAVAFERGGFAVGMAATRPGVAPTMLDDARVMWPNAWPDADALVAPHPFGVELSVVLRSRHSPALVALRVSGRDVAIVPSAVDGSAAVIVRDGRRVGRITKPVAFDAAGRSVPVRAVVIEDEVRLVVDHRGSNVRYPVLVDPAVEDSVVEDSLTPTIGGWTFHTSDPASFSGAVGPGAFGTGQYQTAAATTHADQAYSAWSYHAPGQSFVYRVDFEAVSHVAATGANGSCLIEGIDNGSGWETGGEWSSGGVVGGSGPWSACGPVSLDSKSFCARPSCAIGGSPGNAVTVKEWMDGTGARSTAAVAYVGGATVYLSDDDAPTITSSQAPLGWAKSGLVTWDISAADPGLGMSSISWTAPNGQSGSVAVPCTGTAGDRCPALFTDAASVDASALSEGLTPIELTAHDVLGRASTSQTTTVRVDRTGPVVGLSGQLAGLEDRTVASDAGLRVDAADGSAESPRSGVVSIEVLVDGVRKDFGEQNCSVGSCPMSRSWTLLPSQLSVGEHLVRVVVTDAAGNATTRELDVKVGSGKLTSLAEGARTSRRLVLAAEGYHDQTAVTFQYRLSAAAAWSDVPVDTIRYPDGSPVATWPVAMDQHKSPTLLWDLVGSAGQPGMISTSRLSGDTAIQVRAVLSGGDDGVTQEVWTTLDRSGTSGTNAEAQVGIGSVDLETGNLSITREDVSIPAFKSALTITRTYNSRGGANAARGLRLDSNWSLSLPTAESSAEFQTLINYAELSDPDTGETAPYVVAIGASGEEIVFSESGTGYTADAGYEGYRLTRVMSVSTPGKVARFELEDVQSGTVSSFTGDEGEYSLTKTVVGGQGNTTTYQYDVVGRLTRMVAPHPAGIDCEAPVRGCRALTFTYDQSRLTEIDLVAWDPETSSMRTTPRVEYHYQADGPVYRLWGVVYPQRSPFTLVDHLTYDSGRLSSLEVWGERPWAFAYQDGRLSRVGRQRDSGSSSAWTSVVYDVPRTGSAAPYPMGVADVAEWGQKTVPASATAVFRPDDEPADPVNYSTATIHYLDGYAHEVNVARPGGHIATTEQDRSGKSVRELSAANRENALGTGSTAQDHVDKALTLDARFQYDQDGVRLLDELGPEHDVRLPDGSDVRARRHITYAYDEGAPATGGPFNLPTTVTQGAKVTGQTGEEDQRTTKYEYDWVLRQPTKTIIDPSGLALTTVNVYDDAVGVPVETREPAAPAGGVASARRSVYYTAGVNSAVAVCGNHPEWAGLLCREQPVEQPGTAGLPDLPTRTYEYAYLGQPSRVTDAVGTDTQVRLTEYDAQGRITSQETNGTLGTDVPKVEYSYESTASDLRSLSRMTTSSGVWEFAETHDLWGNLTQTSNRGPGQDTYYPKYYDGDGRLTGTDTQTRTYNPQTGQLATITGHSGSVTNFGTISMEYDADGLLAEQVFERAGVTATTTRDETGTPTDLIYVKTSGCSTNCTWAEDHERFNIHGERVEQRGTQSEQRYSYDAASRLRRAADTAGGTCTTRTYGLDANSNRTSMTVHPSSSGGDCSTSTTPTAISHQYDEADRLTDPGYEYDSFGRVTQVPAGDAGGHTLNLGYFSNGRTRLYEQNGETVVLELDPLLRTRQRTVTGKPVERLFYDDTSDTPYQSSTSISNRFYVSGGDGELAVVMENDAGLSAKPMLQLHNLDGDIVGEAPLELATTQPSARWETDESGVPREMPVPIETVGSTTAANVPFSSGVTLDKPGGVQDGDVLVAVLSAPPGQYIAAPTGWVHIGGGGGGSGSGYISYYHVASSSEPSSYTFPGASAMLRGGLVALRGAETSDPVAAYAFGSGSSTDATLPSVTLNVDGGALVQLVGAEAGDEDGGVPWIFPNPLATSWHLSTGTSATNDRTLAAATRILVNGRGVPTGSAVVTNALGSSASVGWAGITIAIKPKSTGTTQGRYRFLGGHERATELPTGVMSMGARSYLPQIGRFLEPDPVFGGSANPYDYGNGDCVNKTDLDGLMPAGREPVGLGSCKNYIARNKNVTVGFQMHPASGTLAWSVWGRKHTASYMYTVAVLINGKRVDYKKAVKKIPHGTIKANRLHSGDVVTVMGVVMSATMGPLVGQVSCIVP